MRVAITFIFFLSALSAVSSLAKKQTCQEKIRILSEWSNAEDGTWKPKHMKWVESVSFANEKLQLQLKVPRESSLKKNLFFWINKHTPRWFNLETKSMKLSKLRRPIGESSAQLIAKAAHLGDQYLATLAWGMDEALSNGVIHAKRKTPVVVTFENTGDEIIIRVENQGRFVDLHNPPPDIKGLYAMNPLERISDELAEARKAKKLDKNGTGGQGYMNLVDTTSRVRWLPLGGPDDPKGTIIEVVYELPNINDHFKPSK